MIDLVAPYNFNTFEDVNRWTNLLYRFLNYSKPTKVESLNVQYVGSLETAITNLGTEQVELWIDVDTTIVNNTTIPSNVYLRFFPDCIVTVNSSKTLTIYSPSNIIASPNQQIFSGAGTVTFSSSGGGTVVYPQWWGAKGDGSTDDTDEIKAAIASLTPSGSTAGTYDIYSNSTIHFPSGVYVVSSALTADSNNTVTFKTFTGEDAILKVSAGVTCFGGVSTTTKFKRLQIHGGACAISIKTNNTDVTIIDVEDCVLLDQTGNAIQTDTNSGSTLLTVNKCKILNYTGADARVYYGPCGANAIFKDCWVVAQNDSNAAFYSEGRLTFRNMFGVPYGGAGGLIAWVDNWGYFLCYESRFGGEDGGSTYIVRNYAISDVVGTINPSTLIIKDSWCYCASAPVYFYAIPNIFIMKDNNGFADLDPFIVDSTVVAGDLNNIGSYGSVFVVENNVLQVPKYIDSTVAGVDNRALQGLPFISQDNRPILSLPPAIANVTINTCGRTGAFGNAVAGDATPSSTTTDGIDSYTITATAGNQYYSIKYDTMLDSVVAGIYTLAVGIDVTTSHAVKIYLRACNSTGNIFVLGKGRHVITMPFYHDGATENVSIESYNMPDDAVWILTRIAVYTGKRVINQKRIIMEDAAAPVAGTWYIGDYVINNAFATGAAKGWMCTTSGVIGSGCVFTADANW